MSRTIFIGILLSVSLVLAGQKQDTVKHRVLRQWNLSPDFTEEVPLPLDTAFTLFNRYRAADRYSPFNATLGNYGLPFYQISFFDRITDPDKFLISNYYPFVYQPERFFFMNTQRPFTDIFWTFGGAREVAEQTFRVRHSQNINRFFNIGLDYDIIYSLGQYNYQRSEDKDFTLFSSYRGPRYKMYFAAGLNNLRAGENGGITDPGQLANYGTRDVPVKLGGLDEAKSYLKNRCLMLVQKYTVGSKAKTAPADTSAVKEPAPFRLSGTFSHILVLDNNRRTYSDNYPLSGFYDTVFISKKATFDSLFARSIKNTVRFDFTTDTTRKFRLGGGVGFRNELFRYSQIIPAHIIDTIPADTVSWKKDNNVITGRLYNNIGDKFHWIAEGELFLSGYRSGDFSLHGTITKGFDWKKGRALWNVTGSITNTQPSIWYERWGGNHFEWKNNFGKIFRMDAGTSFLYPGRNAELKFNYAIIDNYTDFDLKALPSQHTGGLSVVSLYLRKDLRAWKFHLTAEGLLQKSSNNEVLDLPLATVRSAGYFEHLFQFRKTNGQLNTQLGVDVTYHTLYHPYSYMPATGRFYRQDSYEAGNYPFINVFLNIKLKRTRIFVMLDHLNSGLMGYEYFMVPSYPQSVRMLKYGIAWTFYD